VPRAELELAALERIVARARRRAASVPCLPSVIMRSATRRNSFAFAVVVRISSCSKRDVTMFRSMAVRCAVLRESFR
jgi:hypothetical protein